MFYLLSSGMQQRKKEVKAARNVESSLIRTYTVRRSENFRLDSSVAFVARGNKRASKFLTLPWDFSHVSERRKGEKPTKVLIHHKNANSPQKDVHELRAICTARRA